MKKYGMSTLCYMERNDCYLMMHRVIKENDINRNKWIGVGGHFEAGESPDDCLIREVHEETGYTLIDYTFRGIVTFIYGDGDDQVIEYMHLFTATEWKGDSVYCDEGVLEWIPQNRLPELELWEGDKIFLKLLREREKFFSLKLVYNKNDELIEKVLDGKHI